MILANWVTRGMVRYRGGRAGGPDFLAPPLAPGRSELDLSVLEEAIFLLFREGFGAEEGTE